jgi:hypothetical protein
MLELGLISTKGRNGTAEKMGEFQKLRGSVSMFLI